LEPVDREREFALRNEIIQVCRSLYQKNLVAETDGNVSARLEDAYLLTTPSGVSKGVVQAADLVATDLSGQVLPDELVPRNDYRPSSELRLHLEVYRQRKDVRAVVHAHPPITTAFTVAGLSLTACVLPETLVNLGSIVTTEYATPTSADGPRVIRDLIGDHDALVLDRHGAVTVGSTPLDAYGRMEKVENTALVILVARLLGRVQTLPLDEIRLLSAMRDRMLGPERHFDGPDCSRCGACEGLEQAAQTSTLAANSASLDDIVRIVTDEVLTRLGRA
jgi:L-fuculose-phosphate aldolase